MIRFLVRALAVIAIGYAAIVGLLYVGQERIIFPGSTLPAEHRFAFDVPFEEFILETDGAELNALWFRQPKPRGLVFFLHGNAGNLETWTTGVDYYQRVNYDMFMFDYRGYGKSTGEITSEAELHADVRLAWNAITPAYAGKPVVLYGRSLGAALAARLATEVEASLVVLVSPFESMLAMASAEYPLVPNWALRYPFRNDLAVADIAEPLIFVHGDKDWFIPLSHSEALLERAHDSASLLIVEGAGHNDIHQFETYLDGLTAVLP